jgi:hypothetical protein
MFARVTTLQGPPERLDEGTAYALKQILPEARQDPGWKGLLSLVDRSTGKVLTVTLWESEDALGDSEEAASQVRSQIAETAGQTVSSVERYEVVLYEPAG